MTAKELLSPRYEVVELYPNCPYQKGDILILDEETTAKIFHTSTPIMVGGIEHEELEKHPHIFRKMAWHEKRDEDQMPKKLQSLQDGEIYNIAKWDMVNMFGFIDIEKRGGCDLIMWAEGYGYVPVD